ncbi:MAG: hypothetical protein D6791_03125 [Chloroflexi bacterium]|nr:MAG: hypothetical protein D6791_03125 [Chloroflexota bacterium]
MTAHRIIGVVLVALGAVASVFPDWFGPLAGHAAAGDIFGAVERRVRGGMVLGAGLALLAVPALRPWSSSIPQAILYFLAGALAARFLGLAVDGAVPRQWLLVAIETGLMTLAALWLWRFGVPAR